MMLGRVQVPTTVRKGEPFEVRILVQHPMETGYRRDLNGQAIPMNVVDKLACRIGGREVFSAELGSGMAANPYIAFYVVVDGPGTVEVEWSDDRGERGTVSTPLNVT
ncbi:MAG TPA: thiosulfate oxidation carrier complex protein SoxZ [Usitatibacter sp.]|nr:thiosulfate oxidation carrier complex protein SoxZ [Usitatibacter sp.]